MIRGLVTLIPLCIIAILMSDIATNAEPLVSLVSETALLPASLFLMECFDKLWIGWIDKGLEFTCAEFKRVILVSNADADRPRNFVAGYKVSHDTFVDTNWHRLVLRYRSKGVSVPWSRGPKI
jgi:hypothetical protein